ncbi:hypothetical protein H261_20552 [Paramagnetospirillum caucaseum]|uniref:Uncharacterized protein n=1 Tax=Paramagnetospirillum caucaseum TaxID=1244869 RepID=M3A6B3_9PROT|nr:hypothetical protein H261_20552 [Paramagnetospirillum caucaseum]
MGGSGSGQSVTDGAVRSYRLPLIPVPDGVTVTVPPDFLAALAPEGRAQWAAFRAFDQPVLVLFPALDIGTVESLVENLFDVTDTVTGELLTALVLADAREVMREDAPFGTATLDDDLVAHAGLSDVVELVQFPGHGLLMAPDADGVRPDRREIAI